MVVCVIVGEPGQLWVHAKALGQLDAGIALSQNAGEEGVDYLWSEFVHLRLGPIAVSDVPELFVVTKEKLDCDLRVMIEGDWSEGVKVIYL